MKERISSGIEKEDRRERERRWHKGRRGRDK